MRWRWITYRRIRGRANVRQLENAVERMVVLAGGAVLQRTDVPEEVLNWRADDGGTCDGRGRVQGGAMFF